MIAEIVLQLSYTKNKTSFFQGLNVVLAHDSNTGFQLAIGNSYKKTFIVNNDVAEIVFLLSYMKNKTSTNNVCVVC